MALHVFIFLLVFFPLLLLVLLWRFAWLQLQPSCVKAGSVRTAVPRLLKPRSPLDCPSCRLADTPSPGVRPVSAPVRPWCEVKSRRGPPKRIPTDGFACPNQQCAYFGITDAQIHALVGDGWHGQAERVQTFRCQAQHALYRLKTPSLHVAMVLSALAEGLDVSAAERVFGYRQATITTWLTRAGGHAHTLHERFFCHLHLPHLAPLRQRGGMALARH